MRKQWPVALTAALLIGGVYAVTGTISALGAETHTGCAQFDSSGNIISVTPNCSETVHAPTGLSSMPGGNPCTGAPGTVVLDDQHNVFHINVNGSGDLWITGTDGGVASFVPTDPSAASGQGSWTSWFGAQLNRQSNVFGSTLTARFSMSDGSHVTMHDNSHAQLTPNGVSITRDHPTFSCGG